MADANYDRLQKLEQRIEELERNEADSREWRGTVNTKLDNIASGMSELKGSVQALAAKPGQRWDMLVSAGVAAAISLVTRFIK